MLSLTADVYRKLFNRVPLLLMVSAVPFGLAVALDWCLTRVRIWARGSHVYTSESTTLDWILLGATELLIFAPLFVAAPVFVALHRSAEGGRPSDAFLPSYRKEVAQYLSVLLCLLIVYLVPVFCSASVLVQLMPWPGLWLPSTVLAAGHFIGLYFLGRLGLVLPAVATGRPIRYLDSWRLTRAVGFRAVIAVIVATLPMVVMFIAVTLALYLPVMTRLFSGTPEAVGSAVVAAMKSGVIVTPAFIFLIGIVAAACLSELHKRAVATAAV